MDRPNNTGRPRGNSTNQNSLGVPLNPAVSRRLTPARSRESLINSAASSIRIRRLPSYGPLPSSTASDEQNGLYESAEDAAVSGRRRSMSAPQRTEPQALPGADLALASNEPYMPAIQEGATVPAAALGITQVGSADAGPATQVNVPAPRPGGLANLHEAGSGMQAAYTAGNAARANRGLTRFRSGTVPTRANPAMSDEYSPDVVSLLDLIDPEVQTLGTLTNVQNSLFIPDLGRLVNRRPTYNLTSRPSAARTDEGAPQIARSRTGTLVSQNRPSSGAALIDKSKPATDTEDTTPPKLERQTSISSELTDSHYAVLPHGETLEGWTDEDIAELNDHVRHLLHSRREGFKRSMRGFRKYISKPLGLFVFVYATLITLFGATWVIFLIGWIYVGEEQSYAVDIIDNVLVALFALIGDGMAPFRAVDTYHMCLIAHYHHLTWRLRERREMPDLPDHNDLPKRRLSAIEADVEPGETKDDLKDKAEFSVLTPRQQKRLQYHQAKFSKSHTFYKPHETSTHHAFPLRLLVAVVVLLDCHSLFQIALGTCTWSINYKVRPAALTATILSCSITCNILAGILVSIGDKRTRKKDVLERINRQNLTREAIEMMQKRYSEHERRNYSEIESAHEDAHNGATPDEHERKKSDDLTNHLTKAVRESLGGKSSQDP